VAFKWQNDEKSKAAINGKKSDLSGILWVSSRYLIFWSIVELGIVALGIPVVQQVVVHQVPAPALRFDK
jgi:hypothetical protein